MSWAAMARSSGTTASRARMVSLCVMAGSSARVAILPLAHKLSPGQCAAMDVEILVFDGVEDLDVFGPVSALAPAGFEIALVAEGGPLQVRTAHGTGLAAREPGAAPGVLVVPGGGWISRSERGAWAEAARGVLPALIAERFAAGSTIAAVCTGSMLLAAAGLLDRRPAVTHHGAIDELSAAGARVIGDARVVDDGQIVTAGGVTAGLDLGLWLVQRYRGPDRRAPGKRGRAHPRWDRNRLRRRRRSGAQRTRRTGARPVPAPGHGSLPDRRHRRPGPGPPTEGAALHAPR